MSSKSIELLFDIDPSTMTPRKTTHSAIDVRNAAKGAAIDETVVAQVIAMLAAATTTTTSANPIVVAPPLSAKQRTALERFANKLGLTYELVATTPTQKPAARSVRLSFTSLSTSSSTSTSSTSSTAPLRIVFGKGYIYTEGAHVENAVAPFAPAIEPRWRAMREKRDGTEHHITLIAKHELHGLERSPLEIVKLFGDALAKDRDKRAKRDARIEPFSPLGLGVANEGNGTNVALFVPVLWQCAQDVREQLRLSPKDFHITVGFKLAGE